jgi:hypothetical protein
MMTNWNGTILGPPHVSLSLLPYILHTNDSDRGKGPELTQVPFTECPREPYLQREHPLRRQLPRLPSNNSICFESQSTMC